jgi:hypothetical protein
VIDGVSKFLSACNISESLFLIMPRPPALF